MNRTRLNYVLDAVIGVAGVLSAGTGFAFLFMGSGGYQGGRNPGYATTLLGISRGAWSDLHLWTSVIMIAGVIVHLALHWQWVVCVTKALVQPKERQAQALETCPIE